MLSGIWHIDGAVVSPEISGVQALCSNVLAATVVVAVARIWPLAFADTVVPLMPRAATTLFLNWLPVELLVTPMACRSFTWVMKRLCRTRLFDAVVGGSLKCDLGIAGSC